MWDKQVSVIEIQTELNTDKSDKCGARFSTLNVIVP